ncbi:hypothetical protein ILUMI_18118 [Ignelater luminosus]|uniref:Uncharacterized protein n=1 Tax=Ignelater luminosus TaxID=2038154 RepID=A0A8K0CQV8_IGNLU|nr:hypothetical protein ILUMI_18118 [Ignelater luminosus]
MENKFYTLENPTDVDYLLEHFDKINYEMAENSDIGDDEDDLDVLEVNNNTIALRCNNNDLLTNGNMNNIHLPDSDNDSDIFAVEDSFGESDDNYENKKWFKNGYVLPMFAGTSFDHPLGISNAVEIDIQSLLSCFEAESRKIPKAELRSDRSLKKGESVEK